MQRRTVLSGLGAVFLPVTGCVDDQAQSGTETISDNQSSENRVEKTQDSPSLTDWERSTDCDDMRDSVIQVKRIRSSLGDGYSPISYSDVSSEEKKILRKVTEEGGYGTCEPSEAFDRFVTRVSDHVDQQDGDLNVYIVYNGSYYGIYVEKLDEVYAY